VTESSSGSALFLKRL